MKIIWAPLAVERLEEEVRFIAQDKPEAAHRWTEQLLEHLDQVAAFPRSGRTVPELGREDIREIVHGSHRIIYRIVSDEVRVLAVRHLARLLDEEELQGS